MGKKFVGQAGLKRFWTKAKTWIAGQITAEVTAKIAEIVANAPEDLDTLKEIADWISEHADDAAAMNTQITENKNNIAANSSSISAMNTQITENKNNIAANSSSISALNTQIQTNKDNIATNTSDISALKTSVAGKADKSHTHTKSEITDFPTSLPANGGTANKIEPNYTSVALTEVTSSTTKYIKLAYCNWNQTGTLQVLLQGNCFEDTVVINFGGGNATTPMLCGHYCGSSALTQSVIAQKGSTWNSKYSIYIKVRQYTTLAVRVALLKGNCTIDISESTTAPTNIYEWTVSYGLFGNITAPNITSLEERVTALESKA